MEKDERSKLAKEIREFANEFKNAPLVGALVEVSGGDGGPVTGLSISVSPDPSGRSVVGMSVEVNSTTMAAARGEHVDTLLAAAEALEDGTDPSLIKRMLGVVGSAAANAGMRVAFERLLGLF